MRKNRKIKNLYNFVRMNVYNNCKHNNVEFFTWRYILSRLIHKIKNMLTLTTSIITFVKYSTYTVTYSGRGISGMFHPCETGCNGLVLVLYMDTVTQNA